MSRVRVFPILALIGLVAMASSAVAQTPYVGFVYPAGGQRGTTFQVRLGGQRLAGVHDAFVTGEGVKAKVVEYLRKMGPQDMTLLREQLKILKKGKSPKDEATQKLMDKIQERMGQYCNRPACRSISDLVLVEVTIAPDAKPGDREIRVETLRGVSNPLVFQVGQVPEVSRKPMKTADFQVLGKEELAQRKRPPEEVEDRITVPCTANGQIASGEENLYRFEAHKGQRLVISVAARHLVPYIADAVPGWFQPVLTLYDADGKEVAYDDDYRFKPDPIIFYEVPKDGEYVFSITDAIYRGREDFVYRATISELPFVTSVFPLGARAGTQPTVQMQGWNLDKARLTLPPKDAGPGTYKITAHKGESVSNALPFALDPLPESLDKESNNDLSSAQKVKLPIIVNGRVDRPDDWDVFQIEGHKGDTIVAEVTARRLDSPLDSMLKLTDAKGRLLAFNDDHGDPASGLNTHHADSYLMVKLPADGTYLVHLGDTDRHGGQAYGYRLRISAPRPDFALRVVPSTVSMRKKSSGAVTVYAIRKDGFDGPIKLGLKNPPAGFAARAITLAPTQDRTRLTIKSDLRATKEPVSLLVEGTAEIGDREVSHVAVPAEDQMQAFLWRHLVPAENLEALVYDPSYQPPPKRIHPPPSAETKAKLASMKKTDAPKFSKRQVAGRLRQIETLYQEGLITDEFNDVKVGECEASE